MGEAFRKALKALAALHLNLPEALQTHGLYYIRGGRLLCHVRASDDGGVIVIVALLHARAGYRRHHTRDKQCQGDEDATTSYHGFAHVCLGTFKNEFGKALVARYAQCCGSRAASGQVTLDSI